MSNTEYIYFLNCVYQEFRLNLSGYEEKFLKRRVEQRMNILKCDSYPGYLNHIQREPGEYKKLLDVLGINVTEFFRDPPMWKVLADRVLPEILSPENIDENGVIKIWSSACNTGEEPYSLAILARECLQNDLYLKKVRIVATDINSTVIEKAQERCYLPDRIKNIGPKILDKYFTSLGKVDAGGFDEDQYKLNEDTAENVRFEKCDILNEFQYEQMSVILCRNVLIYFTKAAQASLLKRFHKSLKPKGYLVLGKCETLCEEVSTKFRAIDLAERVYQKM